MLVDLGIKTIYEGLKLLPLSIAISSTTDSTPVSASDYTLNNISFEKPITNILYNDATKKITVNVFVDLNEANFIWKEIGLFAETSSGKLLITKTKINEEKTSLKTANIIWEIFIERS